MIPILKPGRENITMLKNTDQSASLMWEAKYWKKFLLTGSCTT
jgi:hypothetical protein